MSQSVEESHVQVYSGDYIPGNNYKKFDIVQHSGAPGVFYYAKDDVVDGGGAEIEGVFDLTGGMKIIGKKILPTLYKEGANFKVSNFKAGQILNINGINSDDDYSEIEDPVTLTEVHDDWIKFKPTKGSVVDVTSNESINLRVSAIDQIPGESTDLLWSQNDFFFDPDYGAEINSTTETEQIQYGDGYYSIYPRGINSVNTKFNLTFGNRTTREASCIMHFLENKLGQHEVDAPVDYLPYKQGISGFFWGGDSMFFPYNSTENLSKRFVCRSFNHSLKSENSNTVSCVFENFDTSVLRKSEQIWVERVDSWDEGSTYLKNDITFLPQSHKFYYCSGDNGSSAGIHPTGIDGIPTANNPWTREFFWKPSLGLNIEEAPRLKESTMGFSSYKQIYNDGINPSLLQFSLDFKGRDDRECKSILHFLENHYGAQSFSYELPAPYNKKRRFLAPEWSHRYVFKDTHDISCTMVEFPFNFTDEEFDNIVTDTKLRGGEILAPPLVAMGMVSEGEKRRFRIKIQNFGDMPLKEIVLTEFQPYDKRKHLYNLDGVPFASFASANWQKTNITKKDRAVINDEKFGKTRISPNIANGAEGGLYFYTLDENGDVTNKFFQNNQGNILCTKTGGTLPVDVGDDDRISDKLSKPLDFVNWQLITNNIDTELDPGESGYFEVVFNSNSYKEDEVEVAQLTVAAKWESENGQDITETADILLMVFSGTKWRPHQLNQESALNKGTGTVRLSNLSVTSESENTNPYIYYDGNFDGKIDLTVDHTSLAILGDHEGKVWAGGAESVLQWAVSIDGGRSWRMKSAIVTVKNSHTRGEARDDSNWNLPTDLNIFKENWGNAEAGDVNISLCDLVNEDVLGATVTIPFVKKAKGKVIKKNATAAFNSGLRESLYQGS